MPEHVLEVSTRTRGRHSREGMADNRHNCESGEGSGLLSAAAAVVVVAAAAAVVVVVVVPD